MHGELPKAHAPKAAILLIGTNDLGLARRQRNDPMDAAPNAVRRCAPADLWLVTVNVPLMQLHTSSLLADF